MDVNFINTFPSGFPATETMLSFLSPGDAVRLGKTCKDVHRTVGSSLPEKSVRILANSLLILRPGVQFSLKNVPERCKQSRLFVEYALRHNGLDLQFADEQQRRDPILLKTALVSAKLFTSDGVETILDKVVPDIADKPGLRDFIRDIPYIREKERCKSWIQRGFCSPDVEGIPDDDKDIILYKIRHDVLSLQRVSPKWRNDRDVVLAAEEQRERTCERVGTFFRDFQKELQILQMLKRVRSEGLEYPLASLSAYFEGKILLEARACSEITKKF